MVQPVQVNITAVLVVVVVTNTATDIWSWVDHVTTVSQSAVGFVLSCSRYSVVVDGLRCRRPAQLCHCCLS